MKAVPWLIALSAVLAFTGAFILSRWQGVAVVAIVYAFLSCMVALTVAIHSDM